MSKNTFLTCLICTSQWHWQPSSFSRRLSFETGSSTEQQFGVKGHLKTKPTTLRCHFRPFSSQNDLTKIIFGQQHKFLLRKPSVRMLGWFLPPAWSNTNGINASIIYYMLILMLLNALHHFEQTQVGRSGIGIFFNSRNTFSDKCIISN